MHPHILRLKRTIRVSLTAALIAATLAGCGSKAKPTVVEPAPGPVVTDPVNPIPTTPDPALPPVKRPTPALPGALSVMIENHPNARPQAGLEKADLIYELESEAGISRFMAFYYTYKVEKIGPVRSARLGFYDIANAYGVPYAHAGGSLEALHALKFESHTLLNFDEINTCGGCFWRWDDREAPHNLYTSTQLLVDHANEADWKLNPLPPVTVENGPQPKGAPVQEIAYHWDGLLAPIHWVYQDGRYLRSHDEEFHMTESGERVATDNLIVLFTDHEWDGAANGGLGQTNIAIVGEGKGYAYTAGIAHAIEWVKPSRTAHYKFTLAGTSEPVSVNPGQTWVAVLKSPEHLTKGTPGQ